MSDLSSEELKALVRDAVEEALEELLGDPDEGLTIREEVKARLLASMEEVEKGVRGVRLEEVVRRIEQAK